VLTRQQQPVLLPRITTPDALRLKCQPKADCGRYDSLRRAEIRRPAIVPPHQQASRKYLAAHHHPSRLCLAAGIAFLGPQTVKQPLGGVTLLGVNAAIALKHCIDRGNMDLPRFSGEALVPLPACFRIELG
jgi:hypothetical protein